MRLYDRCAEHSNNTAFFFLELTDLQFLPKWETDQTAGEILKVLFLISVK